MPTDLPVKASTFRRVGLLPIQRKTTAFEKQAHTCERGDSFFPWCILHKYLAQIWLYILVL